MFSLNVRFCDVVGIAALIPNDRKDHFTVNINPKEWDKWTNEQRITILMHEMGHAAASYIYRR